MTEVTAHHGLFKDTDLHVDDTGGAGRPVVLIHGWPLSGEAFEHNVGPIAESGYRVVTYDRRGFGRSDRPRRGYDYDTLADDLDAVLTGLDLRDVTLVGFSMGGGEVVRYLARHGSERVRSAVLASAVPPFLVRGDDNPDGPLAPEQAEQMAAQLEDDPDAFFDGFTTQFFSVDGRLAVSEEERQKALALCRQADHHAALECMAAFGGTDFRDDLATVTVPVLVLHGDKDATVPLEGSGARTHAALPSSSLHVISEAPHGVNVSHAEEWNRAVVEFLAR